MRLSWSITLGAGNNEPNLVHASLDIVYKQSSNLIQILVVKVRI